jgi:RNA polymerase sigma-70 factor (ECF subfamily)
MRDAVLALHQGDDAVISGLAGRNDAAKKILFDIFLSCEEKQHIFARITQKIFLFTDNVSEDISFSEDGKGISAKELDAGIPSVEVTRRAAQLIDLYGDKVLRLAYSYLHNMSDAEDILQDTLIQYIKAAPTFESSEHEKAWVLRVAANISKNKIKYNKYRETDELMEELVSEDREDLSFVWEAVKELPDKYREVIHLFYEEGLSTAQIAKVLARRESTVRSDLKRGREKLKTILKEAYDFE